LKDKASKPPSFIEKVKKKEPGYYFRKLDSYDLMLHIGKVKLFQLNLFRDDVKLRKVIIPLIIVAGILWLFQGFDSSVEQIEYFILNVPSYILGKITWSQLVFYYTDPYGKYVHYSAFVIYMLFFVGISKYLREKLDVVNSQNITASICFVAFSVGVFEYFWNISYYFLQNQTWVLTFEMPQFRILLQNIFMITVGLMFILGIDWKKYKPNLDKWTSIFLTYTILLIIVWCLYGLIFPVQTISVQVSGYGTWHSTLYFPQTVYTVDTNILDHVAAGEQFWIQNDLLHLVNTSCKIFLTLTIFNILKIKRR